MRRPCCDKQDTNKGAAWTKQEDEKLVNYIRTHGEGCWRSLPQAAGLLRCGKSCRLRWINYLRPDLKRGNFTEDEEDLIVKLHALLGNRWSLIAGRLPGRTDNEVKNYWNSHLRRKLVLMGIDPNNHRLTRGLPPPRHHSSSSVVQSAISKTTANEGRGNLQGKKLETKLYGGNEQSSDAASGLDVTSPLLPDLNLELTIKIPNSYVSHTHSPQPLLKSTFETSVDQISGSSCRREKPQQIVQLQRERDARASTLSLFR